MYMDLHGFTWISDIFTLICMAFLRFPWSGFTWTLIDIHVFMWIYIVLCGLSWIYGDLRVSK